MTETPDYRINLQAPKIVLADFGIDTTLDISAYPAPGSQARFDWMRSVVLGLLAQQAAFSEPTQRVIGTPWFDLNTLTLRIWSGASWVPYADAVPLTVPDSDGNVVSLSTWYESVSTLLDGLAPEVVFTGRCTVDGVVSINIPVTLQSVLHTESRVFLYINGVLVDPSLCSIIGSPLSTIRLSTISLSSGDTFIVVIKRIGSTFYTSTVVVP